MSAARPPLLAVLLVLLTCAAFTPASAAAASSAGSPGVVALDVEPGHPIANNDWAATVLVHNLTDHTLAPHVAVSLRSRRPGSLAEEQLLTFPPIQAGDHFRGRVQLAGVPAGPRDLEVRVFADGRWIAASRTAVDINDARGFERLKGHTVLVAAMLGLLAAAVSMLVSLRARSA